MSLEVDATKLKAFQHPSQVTISSTDSTIYEEESSICTKQLSPDVTNMDRQQQGSEVPMSLASESVELSTQGRCHTASNLYEEENIGDMGVVAISYPTDLQEQVTQHIVPPTLSRYQVTDVDMPDVDIMMMAIDDWDIGPQVASYLQNVNGTSNELCLCSLLSDAATLRSALLSATNKDVREKDMHSFLLGVDWS
jgi:hypothetical protein